MTHLRLIPAVVFALVLLKGWPSTLGFEFRALLALAMLSFALFPMVRKRAHPEIPRFRGTRALNPLDRLTAAVIASLMLVSLYVLLVQGPVVTSNLSYFVLHTSWAKRDSPAGQEANPDFASASNGIGAGNGVHAKVSTQFDPSGTSIPKAAHLNPSDKPEVRLEMPSPQEARRLKRAGPIYITAYTHDTFDGEIWTTESRRAQILVEDSDGRIELQPATEEPAYHYEILQGRLDDGPNTVNTLQGASYVRLPEVTQIAPGTHLLPSLNYSGTYYQYEAGSTPKRFDSLRPNALQLEAGLANPAYSAPSSHPELNRLIRELSKPFDQDQPLAMRLAGLQSWLRRTYAYSSSFMYPDNGRSPLENFLSNPDGAGGFCVHFASAAALLAREIGVPSRVSYGWTGGQFYDAHGQFVFRGAHAHAWAEIYLKDQGWVVFDATPPSAVPQASLPAAGQPPPGMEAYLQMELEEDLSEDFGLAISMNWKWVGIFGGGGLAALLLLGAVKLRKSAPASSGSNPSIGPAPPPGYLRLFHQTCRDLGHPIPRGRTLAQHLDTLKEQNVPVPFANELLSYHYDITYRNRPQNSSTEKGLRDAIRRWHPPS